MNEVGDGCMERSQEDSVQGETNRRGLFQIGTASRLAAPDSAASGCTMLTVTVQLLQYRRVQGRLDSLDIRFITNQP